MRHGNCTQTLVRTITYKFAMSEFKVFLFLFILPLYETARILAVYPVPSISHQVVFRPLTLELLKHGHEVVVVTTDPMFKKGQTPKNLTEIDTHDISYGIWKQIIELSSGNFENSVQQLVQMQILITDIFEKQLQVEAMKKIIMNPNEHFDLLLLEACVRPTLILTHRFKVPTIILNSFGPLNFNSDAVGAPTHPIFYPANFRKKLYNLTIWEKIRELYYNYKVDYSWVLSEEYENKKMKKLFGPDTPTLTELSNNVDMMFLNVHPVWDDNRPVPPNVIYIGGVHQPTHKEFPKDLKKYLDSSVNGVIYFSLGTNMDPRNLPKEKINVILNVFSQLPYNILWKWNGDDLPGRSENVKISKWFPQSDLLKHPKVKLFITQGGLQSTEEAIVAGVPLVGIPMLGDQWYNVEKYVKLNIGVRLDLENLTEENLKNVINTVIDDESYRANIKKLHSVMYDQPQSPLERAVWWAEYVMRHRGARHMRASAANVTWTEYLVIDVVAVLLLALLAIISSVVLLARLLMVIVRISINYKIKTS